MLCVTGRVESVRTREAGNAGNTWTEHTLVVRDWGQTLYVVAGRELVEAGLPAAGEDVVLEVSVRPYLSRKTGEAGAGYTAHRRSPDLEAKVYPAGLKVAASA